MLLTFIRIICIILTLYYKGETNMKAQDRVKMTLLLDSETITILKKYSYEATGSTNVSKAVMSMAKEHESRNNSKHIVGK